jgi:hypothetical protein
VESKNLVDLVGKDLTALGFSVNEMTEVYRTNDDGVKIKSLGFFLNEEIAIAFAQLQADSAFHKTVKTYVLTNGKVGFVFGAAINLLDDEEAALKIRENALRKLSKAERQALGL